MPILNMWTTPRSLKTRVRRRSTIRSCPRPMARRLRDKSPGRQGAARRQEADAKRQRPAIRPANDAQTADSDSTSALEDDRHPFVVTAEVCRGCSAVRPTIHLPAPAVLPRLGRRFKKEESRSTARPRCRGYVGADTRGAPTKKIDLDMPGRTPMVLRLLAG